MDDEFIWGRGTLDCKHGVLAILEAISKLSAEGFQPKRSIYVALGHDEEIGGADGNSKMAAWFRSHRIRLHAIIDEGGCVFTEFFPYVICQNQTWSDVANRLPTFASLPPD